MSLTPRLLTRAALAMLLAALALLAAYLAFSVPAAWFPGAASKAFPAAALSVNRGRGEIVNDELQVIGADSSGLILVSQVCDLMASDYAAIAWIATDVSSTATVRLLWRTQQSPNTLNSIPIELESGRTLPAVVADDPHWVGRITGLALAIQGPLSQPVRIRGVIAKPMGALEVLGDRAREWSAIELWSGTSINTVNGGADVQEFPLPVLLALSVALAAAGIAYIERRRPGTFAAPWPVALAALVLVAWLILDIRWFRNLTAQEFSTASQYAGKTTRDKHLASEDATLFEFVERAREILPKQPSRIFLAAGANYFRGRAAYHLYPHSVYYDPRSDEIQWMDSLHPGDWVLVYQQRGILYDPAKQLLKWPTGQTTSAELKLTGPGGALFLVR